MSTHANPLRSFAVAQRAGCLRDHPHDNTSARVAVRLGELTAADVEPALVALETDDLVARWGKHWQLTTRGWRAVGPSL